MRHLEDREKTEAGFNTSIRVRPRSGHFEEKVSGVGADTLKQKPWPVRPQFARLPVEVLRDNRLSHTDLRVYCEMAYASRGASVSIGVRKVGERLGLKKTVVAESITRLCAMGHLRPGGGGRGKRMIYVMESRVFGDVAYIQGSGVPYRVRVTEENEEYRPPVRSLPKSYRKEKAG